MLSPGELALFLRASAARVKPALVVEAGKIAHEAASTAKEFIGHERSEWKPLSDATMEGFQHPYGFHVPGKTELGFTGQVSSTDPLLRTGDLKKSIQSDAEITEEGARGVAGSSSKIALYQEMGTANALLPIPPRPFLAAGMNQAAKHGAEELGHVAIGLLSPGIR